MTVVMPIVLNNSMAYKYTARDTRLRSLIKTVTWRTTGSLATFGIAWAVTGNLALGSTIVLIQVTANTVLYYLHERIWSRIQR